MAIETRMNAIITGASGGMGRACARSLGATMNLVLTDVAAERLHSFAAELEDEGFSILATVAGDLGDANVLNRILEVADAGLGVGALVHTAGLSPVQSDWKNILKVNSLVTKNLVHAMDLLLRPGTVAVLVASMAGYVQLPLADAERILSDAKTEDDLEALRPHLFGVGASVAEADATAAGMAYVLSKRAVLRLAERMAMPWGARGARIVSISPGLILTAMGRKEAEVNPQVKMLLEHQPVQRWGTASDIAAAVQFLVSPAAGFITGCDLRIDGGATAMTQQSSL